MEKRETEVKRLARGVRLSGPAVGRSESEATQGHEGLHAEHLREIDRAPEGGDRRGGVGRLAMHRDLTRESHRPRFVSALLVLSREVKGTRDGIAGVLETMREQVGLTQMDEAEGVAAQAPHRRRSGGGALEEGQGVIE